MEFKFNSEEEKLALTADDKQVYALIANDSYPLRSRKAHEKWPVNLCSGLKYTGFLNHQQPGTLPITSDDLQLFINSLESNSAMGRYMSVCWVNGKPDPTHDFVYADEFRRVTVLGNLELSIRPVHRGDGPKRLHIHTADAHDCAVVALNVVVNTGADGLIAAVMGEGLATDPRDTPGRKLKKTRPKVGFEWKITFSPDDDLARRVKSWRYDICGGSRNFHIREREYRMFLKQCELQNPREGKGEFISKGKLRLETEEGTDPKTHLPASFGQQSASRVQPGPGPQQAVYQQGKRPSWEMGGQEFGPSLKRRSTGSQTWGSSSQSSMSSPEFSRPPSVADPRQAIMGPPPPGNFEHRMRQTWNRSGSSGSWGSIGPGTARVTSAMAGLTVQSPSWGSPEGVAPTPEGSPGGVPQAMAGTTFGQPGGGYGHYSQDYVRPSPAYGQPTEVYGHPGQHLQRPLVRPFQVGIAHTQIPGGEWPSPQPWRQQQMPVQQGHLQYSQQPGQPAGFLQRPPGSRYIMTESPQLQGLTAASIPSSFPPNPPPPMTQSLPPPSMSGIDPAQFQAVTCPPVGHSYPSSLPPTTQSTPAELIDPPEPEDLSTDSESYSESESDSEDGHDHYQTTQLSQPLLDNGRFYQSPEPAQQSHSDYQDPYWGANDADED